MYKRQYYEKDDDLTTFVLYLYNPSQGGELGYQSTMTVYYYDDPLNMNDAYYSYPTLNGLRNSQSIFALLIGSSN